MDVLVCITTSCEWEFLLFYILVAFGGVGFLDFGHFNRCVVVSCFSLHFPDDIWCDASFQMLSCHMYIFFAKVSNKIFCPFLIGLFVFFFWVFTVLCIFCIIILYELYLLQVCSPSLCLSSNSLDIVLLLMKSSLLFISWRLCLLLYPIRHHHTQVM